MKNECNQLNKPSLLYIFIREMVFLKETQRALDDVLNQKKLFFGSIKTWYKKLLKNELVEASLMLSGYMAVSTLILLIAYKLVLVY
ncbi:hypothetical protein [Winogradskyella sp.]|uniref:hypothetical protein n=1 Tax=Winogradskyella sp. TaxID=1883156 RepID=UPI00260D535D|nr:hypothetical protein [Winogradskyella sp.]